ncbi:LysR substrate-binding domain-containing protein [Paracoccus albus]|uniref:LysR substrate-binding domain-containing protein n=1 Tax=Paracoccus albus TaxID=3017784 RepID=UPI0022F0CB58|nr:LysR substrate-binding domain-containing protein [Paracoccus albus]WBU59397.1 LysR substrate-binding domain-containing protein [Paracoccus albus]
MQNLNRISLSGLRAIEAVARLGSLGAAAAELGVTAGALSQRISRTEAQLGQPVFDRTSHGLRPTDTGALVIARLLRGMTELSAAVSLADPIQEDVLNISAAPLFASRWLIWRLPRFHSQHPGIRVRIEPVVTMITPGVDGIDIGLRVGGGDWPGVRTQKLLDQRVLPVCAPALARDIKTPADLLELPLIRENDHFAGWREWLALHEMSFQKIAAGPEYADGGLCLDAAISGQGVFMAWETLAADAIADGRLVAPVPGRALSGDAYWFVSATEGRRKPAIAKFHKWLQDELLSVTHADAARP